MKRLYALIFLSFFFTESTFSQTNKSGITLLKKTVIGGEGGWDYVSVSAEDRRIYLSHNNQVEVLDIDTHQKIGEIKNTNGVHGIVAIPSVGKGYVTNGKTNNVTVFDIKSLQTKLLIPAGVKPDALLYDKYSNRVFIFNNDSKNITVIDVKIDSVIQTFDIGGNPEAGVSNDKGLVYVNLEDTNEIVAFESKTLTVKHRFSLAPAEQPTGLAFDKQTHSLFSACRKSQLMLVVDADNGNIIAKIPIGKGVDGAAFNDKTKLAFSSNGDGTMTVVKEVTAQNFVLLDTIKTFSGARTMAIDNKTKHLFTVTAQFGETPTPTKENPRPRPAILPNTFMLLEYGTK